MKNTLYFATLDFKEGTTNLCYDEEAQLLSFDKFDENLKF